MYRPRIHTHRIQHHLNHQENNYNSNLIFVQLRKPRFASLKVVSNVYEHPIRMKRSRVENIVFIAFRKLVFMPCPVAANCEYDHVYCTF